MGKPTVSVLYGAVLRDSLKRFHKVLEDLEALEAVLDAPMHPDEERASEDEIAVCVAFQNSVMMAREQLAEILELEKIIARTSATSPEAKTVVWALGQVPSDTLLDLMGRRAAIEDTFGGKKASGG
jgi:hypothetical protein